MEWKQVSFKSCLVGMCLSTEVNRPLACIIWALVSDNAGTIFSNTWHIMYITTLHFFNFISTDLFEVKIKYYFLCLFRHCQYHYWWSLSDNDNLWTHQENVHLFIGHRSFRLCAHRECTRRHSGNYMVIFHNQCYESYIFTYRCLFNPQFVAHTKIDNKKE